MLSRRRARRQGERGQVLALALAFILFFGVLTVSVLGYAGAVALQHSRTEATALSDTGAEGGAQFALADSNRGDAACASGRLTMQGGDVVSYACNSTVTGTAGASCLLCLIQTPGNVALRSNHNLTVPGEIDISGNAVLTQGATVTSAGPRARIDISNGSFSPTTGAVPSPVTVDSITDPLASLPAPDPNGPARSCCAEGQTSMSPGVYSGISDNDGNITLQTGTYVITGPWRIGGTATFTSKGSGGVIIYLQGAAASISLSGDSVLNLSPFVASAPDPSPYSGIVVLSDGGGGIAVTEDAQVTLAGTVYAPSSIMRISDTATTAIAGRLIVTSLTIAATTVTGQTPDSLIMTGTVPSGINSCTAYQVEVTGTSSLGKNLAATATGRAVLKAGCNGGSGIVDFNYGS